MTPLETIDFALAQLKRANRPKAAPGHVLAERMAFVERAVEALRSLRNELASQPKEKNPMNAKPPTDKPAAQTATPPADPPPAATATIQSASFPDDLITLKQAARVANGTHKNTVLRWILDGRLPAWRIGTGRMYYVSRADVLAMIRRVEIEPNPIKGVGPSRTQIDRQDREAAARLKAMGVG
jgi:excisionase family DNA binding protein